MDVTYCASPCQNFDCPRHQVNAPEGWRISYALFHKDCDEYQPYGDDEPDHCHPVEA
jgi:hypothetical protein